MTRLRVIALAVLVLFASASGADLPVRFDPARDAVADVAMAVRQAQQEGKRVLVDVGGEWCAWCRIMDQFFASNERARTIRDAHYVWVKVNWSRENRNEALLSRWPRISGYPHLFVLGADGSLLHSQDTSLLENHRSYDAGKFIAFLERWKPRGT